MRDLPRTTRIAIVHLYLRFRSARKLTTRFRGEFGQEAKITLDSQMREIENWNALQSMRAAIYRSIPETA